jgi:chromosome segregation ATPase
MKHLSEIIDSLTMLEFQSAQFEIMMATMKNEARALEATKKKLKDYDELKEKVIILSGQLSASEESNRATQAQIHDFERLNGQLRGDMQSLNDLYNTQHSEFQATRQSNAQMEQEIIRIQQEMVFFQKESQKNLELRKINQALTSQVAQLLSQIEEERASTAKSLMESGRRVQEVEKEKADLSAHFWNLKEESNSYKSALQDSQDRESAMQRQLLDLQLTSSLFRDRALMVTEDQRAADVRGKSLSMQRTNEVVILRGEVSRLQNALAVKSAEADSLALQLKSAVEARQTERADLKLKNTEMTEVSSTFFLPFYHS